jgi:hypothetical protein
MGKQKGDLSASAMRNTRKVRKGRTQSKAKSVTGSVVSGYTTNEEAFSSARWFRICVRRKGCRYCRFDNRRFAGKGAFVW